MAHQTKPVNLVFQDAKPGQIFHVVNTAAGARTALPAGVTTMKTIVSKDLASSGSANLGQDSMGAVTSHSGIVATAGTTATAVISGQSFTMPVVRKLSPGQKLITVPKHKLILPTSATNKTVNGKAVVISPKLYKVISTSSQQPVSRNLTFAAPANAPIQNTVTAIPTNSVTLGSVGATIAIPSTSAISQSSFTLPTSSNNAVRYSTNNAKAPVVTTVANNSAHATSSDVVSVGNRVIIASAPAGESGGGGGSEASIQSVSSSSPSSSTTTTVTSKKLQQPSSHSNNQQHQHSYSKKTSPSQIHTPASRRRKTDKAGRGLRHFSMKVCEKVKAKGTTTYNEVANELVAEETQNHHPGVDPATYDQKNIRRRVYDALNVLMAMKIISKEKKEIRWHGLPSTNTQQECEELEKENEKARRQIEVKEQQFRDLVQQHVALKSLIARNKANEERGLVPNPSSAVQLPFIIVNTDRKTNINCSISNDKSEYSFKFEDTFEIHDDLEILKRMGLSLGLDRGQCSETDIIKIKSMVPKSVEKYIDGKQFEKERM
ncbi:transcription factor Dp [Anopheles ziemanni]|uniref:transcription factor Dp n=1 Tax=Anopheles coustani TaxID=139045 RepID=UPI0026580962|nr:transcription factor Dp [Anopheles coustani]XP_058169958.1 transcription factor Dp [Anopheles ziemanni]